MQVKSLLNSAIESLTPLSDSPRLDAEVLLGFSLKKNRTWLATWPDKNLTEDEITQFKLVLNRRILGEPIAHITGTREFWSLELKVSKDTLIPRPETELMIDTILALCSQKNLNVLDLGTGSGAIALALASEQLTWKLTAIDQSIAALEIAKRNAQQLKLTNTRFLNGSWFKPVKDQTFDIIASNPPYIPNADPHLSQGDVQFEPRSALASGEDGLDDIRHITQQAADYLKPNGLLIIEHGFDQKSEIYDIFTNNQINNITQVSDLSGNPRLTYGFKQ